MTEQLPNSQTNTQAKSVKIKAISPIWFLPIVAGLLGLWILFQNVTHANSTITIHFQHAESIIVDKTRIRYKGVIVGTVKKIELDSSNGVNVIAEIEAHAKFMLRENTQFWLVSPKASLTAISGLDTLFSGSYINLNPGIGDSESQFTAVSEQPISIPDNALLVNLSSENAGSISVGTPLFYKQIKVGEVVRIRLADDNQRIDINAFINERYSHLIKEDSKFWNISGLAANISASGIDFKLESLTSLIAGGITFSSPNDSMQLIDEHTFTLYDSIDKSEIGLNILLILNNINNLPKGAGILYKGLGIGRITDIQYSMEKQHFIASATINPQFSELVNEKAQFWLEKTSLSFSKIENIGNIITGDFIGFSPDSTSTSSVPTKEITKQDLTKTKDNQTQTFVVQETKIPSLPGLSILLLADDATGLNIGDPISYQGVEVGNITHITFSDNGQFIETTLRINHQYQYLVNSSSQFYLLNGINVKASLKGLEVQSAPLKNLVSGGIGLYNQFPVSKNKKQPKLHDNIKFRLYPSKAMAQIGKNVFSEPYSISLLSKQLPSINEGSPVYYHKFPIGEVSHFSMDSNGLMRTTLAIKGQYKHLIQQQSVFWDVSGIKVNAGLSGIEVQAESLLSIASGGIAVDNAPNSINNRFDSGEYRLFESYQQATQPSKQISITFDEGYELKVGTKLRLKGLVVGEVTSLTLNKNQRVQVNVDIQPEFIEQVTKKSTRFWIIRSEISLSGAKNLSTIISGVYLNVHPGEGALSTRFVGEATAPSIANQKMGLPIVLVADNAGSTDVGSPIYHRQVQIGEVVEKQLSKDASAAEITINIYPQYSHIIRENSIFWPASGFNIDIGITGASLKSTSLTSLIKGGINMSTSDNKALQPAAKAFSRYNLKTSFDEDWLKWRLAIPE
tara:strand:- start:1399 stop:4122 length:2724 start_codon:yes stop_codon:yes gene_type:complete